jgi:DNA-binding NarL/FixJ family response regulator
MEQPITVLVVDDLPRVRDALATMLSSTGEVEVVGSAANGREALELARALRPDVVIMDLEMPVMDGFAATEAVVAEGLAAVVVLSIHTGAASRARARAAGASAFVEKCGRPERLLQALRDARRAARPAADPSRLPTA